MIFNDRQLKFRITLVMLLSLLACFKDEVVAMVDGFEIKKTEVKKSIKTENENYDPLLLNIKENRDALKEGVLERLIQEAIVLNEAGKLGVKVSDEQVESMAKKNLNVGILKGLDINTDVWREKQRRKLIASAVIDQLVGNDLDITDQDIKDYYKKNNKFFFVQEQFHALRIVVEEVKTMQDILKRLDGGEDFSFLAREFSVSPDNHRGGDLGFFDFNSFPTLYIEVCSKLKEGQVSDVIYTDYGYMLLKLVEKKPARQLELSEVEDEIRKTLKEKESRELFGNWLAEAKGRANIVINKEVLEDIDVK